MNKKVVIIFAILLSFFIVGGGCYFLLRRNKVQEIEKEEPDVLKVAKKDIFLCCQQLDDYKQKVIDENKVRQEDLEKSIKILKDQGIWDNEIFFDKRYLDVIQESDAFQLQLYELLQKVETEEDLKSFRAELEKLSEKRKKDIDAFVEFGQRIKKEAEKPMPFFATWTGLAILAIIGPLISFFICQHLCQKQDEKDKDYCWAITILFVTHFFLQFLIFPLLNCLLSLKISSFREVYKHYFINVSKLLFLCLLFFVTSLLSANKLVNGGFFAVIPPEKDNESSQDSDSEN